MALGQFHCFLRSSKYAEKPRTNLLIVDLFYDIIKKTELEKRYEKNVLGSTMIATLFYIQLITSAHTLEEKALM